ncbi:NAD-dependent epimerase/dehydratase family protein [Bacillus cytotoxicus]|uniref:NAD-dependent epimerase/dehydratase family protein n=1 Tax=Bacillus cytotoxicus TaxID=580165 RepID=A0ACC6A395_9BACI|nr:NAD-dependent epimerase/dehydratase family protein [Bacillus cytotoxicus]HDX9579055.1 NAD-dependent epimerase/dehydratase family protein [Bacillus pseudomycoides]
MKILITGDKGYVGMSLKKWLSQWPDKYSVDHISLRNEEWKKEDFSQYDVLFHVAAIVHKKEQPEMESLYYKINRNLTVELANKAKRSGIKQFIFMSTVAVYGQIGEIGKEVVIDENTPCLPTTFYGKSKLEAEIELDKLRDENFKIAILRVPMVYGPGCPGNYEHLKRLTIKLPVFPSVSNKRSMIFINNLSEFVRLLIDNQDQGLFFPQNKEYVNTSELVKLIAKEKSKKIYLSKTLSIGLNLLCRRVNIANKVFGNLIIDSRLSGYMGYKYCVVDLVKSIEACEKNIEIGARN